MHALRTASRSARRVAGGIVLSLCIRITERRLVRARVSSLSGSVPRHKGIPIRCVL